MYDFLYFRIAYPLKVNRPFGDAAPTFADHVLNQPSGGHRSGFKLNVEHSVALPADRNLDWFKLNIDDGLGVDQTSDPVSSATLS